MCGRAQIDRRGQRILDPGTENGKDINVFCLSVLHRNWRDQELSGASLQFVLKPG